MPITRDFGEGSTQARFKWGEDGAGSGLFAALDEVMDQPGCPTTGAGGFDRSRGHFATLKQRCFLRVKRL